MPLRTGAVVLGRHRLGAQQPSAEGLERWAVDRPEGTEVVSPAALAALRPGAAEHFDRAHAAAATHPAVLPSLARGSHEGRPIAVRPATAGAWPAGRFLTPEQAVQLARWLGPGILVAADALGGELFARDLAILADGEVRIAPSGVLAPHSPVLAPPGRAPEVQEGGSTSAASALFGLGVLLRDATVGELPDQVASLLASEPHLRLAAAAALGPATAPAHVPVAPRAPTSTTGAAPLASAPHPASDLAEGDWLVVLDAAALSGRGRRDAAALTGATTAALGEAAARRLLVPVSHDDDAQIARNQAQGLVDLGLPARVEPRRGSPGARRTGRLALAALGLFVALALAVPLAPSVPALLGAWLVLAVLASLAAVGLGGAAVHASRKERRVDAGRRLVRSRDERAPLAREVASVRREILRAALAAPVRDDLLEVADLLAERMEGVGEPPAPALLEALRDAGRSLSAAVAEASMAAGGADARGKTSSAEDVEQRLDRARAAAAAARRRLEG